MVLQPAYSDKSRLAPLFTTHTLIFDTNEPWQLGIYSFFSVKVRKIESSFEYNQCQQFILMENLLSVSGLGAPS